MKTWNQLFVRHGWLLKEEEENVFDCKQETASNLEFLQESLQEAQVEYSFDGSTLILSCEPVNESDWIDIVDFPQRGRGEGLWFVPGKEDPKVRELDTFISGIVRQLNRLGYCTNGSCDGHGRRPAHVSLVKNEKSISELVEVLNSRGQKRIHCREHGQSIHLAFPYSQERLLDLTETLSLMEEAWLDKGVEFIKEQLFYHLLEELLSIPGASGNEAKVRDFVKEKLTHLIDHISVDRYGNLLAEKKYRTGQGPTILLNAHLDLARELEPGRTILKEEGIWSSSKGILGADDRAGVAVLLHVAEQLKNSSFSGKVKLIFTIEEEIGLVGARNVDEYFLWGTDAAIVADRRGKNDIVTSCGGYIPFCQDHYGEFFENIANNKKLNGWKSTSGGSSDTRVWAEHGIQSVNLSVGYQNEHTADEYLDVNACYQTAKLVQSVFEHTRELGDVLRGIRRERVS